MKLLRITKDKLYYYLVEKNEMICREYQDHVDNNQIEHSKKRWKHWLFLIKLNYKYRLMTRNNIQELPPHSKKKRHLPYLDGAESSVCNRQSEYHFAKSLLNYDVISFDIFDTLLLRPFCKPEHLFMIVGEKFDCLDFMKIRKDAEAEARKIAMANNGNHEVSIFDIYSIVEREMGIDARMGAMTEIEIEIEFCFANPYMKRVFDILVEHDKRIILGSDMYLPKEYMEKLLKKCGYVGYEKLYVSCDYLCNKRQGGLFSTIQRDIGKNSKLIHIGDNYDFDILSAKKQGIETKYYKNVHTIGNQYRADGMSTLIGSAYAGIVNTHLHNGTKQYSPYYEYGFIYGGLYVLGYCHWIYQKCKLYGITKILFLSRDGEIYKKVYDSMGLDIESEYVYWSRIANCKYASRHQRSDIVLKIVTHRSRAVTKKTVAELIHDFHLDPLLDKLSEYHLKPETMIVPESEKKVRNLLLENWDVFIDAFAEERQEVEKYLTTSIGSHKKIAVIDVGWNGTGPMGIKSLVENEWKLDCEVFCMVAANLDRNYSKLDIVTLKETVESYLFSATKNRLLYNTHPKTNKYTNNLYFEIFTQAKSPSFLGISQNKHLAFDIPEVENYQIIDEVHNGIFDFTSKYYKTFGKYPYLFNISGYDAYCSFRMIIRDLKLIKKFFCNFRYSRGVIGDSKNQVFETLDDIFRKIDL